MKEKPNLAECLKIYKELQKQGLVPPDYNLVSPYCRDSIKAE